MITQTIIEGFQKFFCIQKDESLLDGCYVKSYFWRWSHPKPWVEKYTTSTILSPKIITQSDSTLFFSQTSCTNLIQICCDDSEYPYSCKEGISFSNHWSLRIFISIFKKYKWWFLTDLDIPGKSYCWELFSNEFHPQDINQFEPNLVWWLRIP